MLYKFVSWLLIYRKIINFSTIIAVCHITKFANNPFAKLNRFFKAFGFSVVVL